MINTNMEISDLVETIANSHGRFDTFYFVMEENIEGTTAFEFIRGSEDAVAFLFDADIHLWTLVSFETSTHWYDSRQWTVRLARYEK